MLKVPISQSYWVIPNVILAGQHPAAASDRATRARLHALLQAGITSFVDLTEPTGLRYEQALREETEAYEIEVRYKNFPIRDFSAPTVRQVTEILDYIDLAISDHKLIYVHCLGGIGRTGTIVGCYLVRHGMDGRAALAKIAELRKGISPNWARSPEIDDQVERVLNWQIGQ